MTDRNTEAEKREIKRIANAVSEASRNVGDVLAMVALQQVYFTGIGILLKLDDEEKRSMALDITNVVEFHANAKRKKSRGLQ